MHFPNTKTQDHHIKDIIWPCFFKVSLYANPGLEKKNSRIDPLDFKTNTSNVNNVYKNIKIMVFTQNFGLKISNKSFCMCRTCIS